ncbi:hypothetical protein SDC9_163308 [bioreactor metagenome]|uniref:Uncharacterized protein n=1 Tax=bioreactor metagenome TaxID=1076179 RepID=A0A645FQS9_9ZZZZ
MDVLDIAPAKEFHQFQNDDPHAFFADFFHVPDVNAEAVDDFDFSVVNGTRTNDEAVARIDLLTIVVEIGQGLMPFAH